jgi:uncharacterized protein YndB with AHSA1/START domain
MSQLAVEAKGTTRATPEVVWSLVANANLYPQWGPWDDGGYETGDSQGEHGVGSIQWFSTGRTKSVERIVELEENRRLVYVVVRGIPVRNYRAEISLTPTDAGTDVRWVATWDKTLLGRLVHRKLRTFYPEMMLDLIAAADGGARRLDAANDSSTDLRQ